MKNNEFFPISLLIKPSGSMCNMSCKYCFYRDEAKYQEHKEASLMTVETLENVFKNTLPYATGRCIVTFQGGEPTLSGLDFFKKAAELEKKYAPPSGVRIENTIQTNGLLIDDKWAKFFYENRFLVGLSLDGTKEIHDQYRVLKDGSGTFDRVMEASEILKRHNVDFNVLSVLTKTSCKKAAAIYDFFDKKSFLWQQYIPCLNEIGDLKSLYEWSLESGDLAGFLKNQFDLWYRDFFGGHTHFNRYFDNLCAIIIGLSPESCDMVGVCSRQLVAEADGSVYPCDFYAVDSMKLGNFNENTLSEIEEKRRALGFIEGSKKRDEECAKCKWFFLCRGGCLRHRAKSANPVGCKDRNRFCDDFKEFFEYAYPRLVEVSKAVLAFRSGK